MLDELTQLIEDGAKAAGSALWALSDAEVAESLRAAHHGEQVLALLKTRLVRQAVSRGIPTDRGHRTTARWLRSELLLDPHPARELAEQAGMLAGHPAVEQAVLDGLLDMRRAAVIAAAVDAIPETLADLDSEERAGQDEDADGADGGCSSGSGADSGAEGRGSCGGADGAGGDGRGSCGGADGAGVEGCGSYGGACGRAGDGGVKGCGACRGTRHGAEDGGSSGAAAADDAARACGSDGRIGCPDGGLGGVGGCGTDGGAADPDGGVIAGGADDGAGCDGTASAEWHSGSRIAREAEAALLARAGDFPAYLLHRLGNRILAHVAPEIAERAEERALQRAEARARRSRALTLSLPRDGRVRLSGVFGVEDAATIGAALDPLCTPLPEDSRTAGQRRADALTEVCRLALRTTELPEHGGDPAQLTVTVPYHPPATQLRADGPSGKPDAGRPRARERERGRACTDSSQPGERHAALASVGSIGAAGSGGLGRGAFGAGELADGTRVSAATVRRLACDARILPVVLGGAGQVLDVGRARRLATGALRRALAVRDRGCAFPGCDRPPRWCDAHHLFPWASGGRTSIDNLVLLCRLHHTTVHDRGSGWRLRLGSDRLPEFVPPAWRDRAQRPRRNEYHMRT